MSAALEMEFKSTKTFFKSLSLLYKKVTKQVSAGIKYVYPAVTACVKHCPKSLQTLTNKQCHLTMISQLPITKHKL